MQVHMLGHREMIPCAWVSVSSGEPNSNPIRAAASSVEVNRLRFMAKFAAASNKEGKEGHVCLSPPLEALFHVLQGADLVVHVLPGWHLQARDSIHL